MSDDKVDDAELSDVEQDAINSIVDVKGELTENEGLAEVEEEEKKDEQPDDSADETPDKDTASSDGKKDGDDKESDVDGDKGATNDLDKPTPELEPEKDQAGVYEDNKLEDPGDFKPADYSFEVKTTDGKTHKISTPEDADAFAEKLDGDSELITASQFSTFNRKAALMEQGIAFDKREYETQKTEFDNKAALEETRNNTVVQINNGFNYLESKGELDKLAPEMQVAGAWEKNPDAPGVKERLAVLKYMDQENERRIANGLDPSFDIVSAHNAMQLEQMRQGNKDESKAKVQERRQKGAKVGGSASWTPENKPKNSIIGTGGTLSDLVTEFLADQ